MYRRKYIVLYGFALIALLKAFDIFMMMSSKWPPQLKSSGAVNPEIGSFDKAIQF